MHEEDGQSRLHLRLRCAADPGVTQSAQSCSHRSGAVRERRQPHRAARRMLVRDHRPRGLPSCNGSQFPTTEQDACELAVMVIEPAHRALVGGNLLPFPAPARPRRQSHVDLRVARETRTPDPSCQLPARQSAPLLTRCSERVSSALSTVLIRLGTVRLLYSAAVPSARAHAHGRNPSQWSHGRGRRHRLRSQQREAALSALS